MDRHDLARLPEAKPLTEAEYEAWLTNAAMLDQRVKAGLRTTREGLWQTAQALYEFSEATGWRALGYDGIGDWLDEPGVDLPYSTFNRLVACWREYVAIRHVDLSSMRDLEPAKAQIVLPALKAGEITVSEAIEDAGTLSQRELRAKYTARPAPPAPDPAPEPPEVPAIDSVQHIEEPIEVVDGEPVLPGMEIEIVRAPAELLGLDPALPTPDELAYEEYVSEFEQVFERARAVHDAEHPQVTEEPSADRLREALVELAGQVEHPFPLSAALSALLRTTSDWRSAIR